MNAYTLRVFTFIAVSVLVAILLASALNSFTHVSDSALADNPLLLQGGGSVSPRGGQGGDGGNAPRTAPGKNYLPIIFLNSATAGGAWLLAGNAGTNPASDFLGTTDNVTFTIRVSDTVAYRIVPAVDPSFGFAPNIIGGFGGNTVAPGVYGATIAGGGVSGVVNVITGTGIYAFIGGGFRNTASRYAATIGGGANNTASGFIATIGGGNGNTASYDYATVSGGHGNTASGNHSTVGGGYQNTASGNYSTVGGGYQNTASGNDATVPGGAGNVASGNYSLAAGQHANTNNRSGAFVWADAITTTVLYATTPNQFLVRATGGILFATSANLSTGCSIPAGGGAWNCTSDRNVKANFADVDSRAILAQVNALPITTWNYTTQDASIRHIGPMAQDFAAAFKVGENDTTISTVDAQGVALAAIRGLSQENNDLRATVAEQTAQVANLQSQNAQQQNDLNDVKARLSALEQGTGTTPNPLQVKGASAFTLNNLPLWGILGLLALLLVRRRK